MARGITNPIDQQALKILFATYWAGSRWRDEKSPSTPPDDFKYAKRAGVMFDPVHVTHDDIMKRVLAAVSKVKPRAVADAFLVSLAAKRMDLRSALGSYAVFLNFTKHAGPKGRGQCRICGVYGGEAQKEDLNVLNFERLKWGGVRHHHPLYASLDLELFRKLPRAKPTKSDVKLFKELLRAIDAAPSRTRATTLQKFLAPVFPSNKAERDNLVGILGFCGILASPAHPNYLQGFVPESKSEQRNNEMAYPVCWWKRADGINQQALDFWFGHVL